MPQIRFNVLNLGAFVVFTILASAFQSTFWFQVFGSMPAPILWINVALYLTIFRQPMEGILTIYFLLIFVSPFTSMKLGLLALMGLLIFVVMLAIKKRVYWPGYRYFLYSSFGSTVLFEIGLLLYSGLFEKNSASIHFLYRFGEILVTGIFAVPSYFILTFLDRLTDKEFLPEAGDTTS